MSLMAPRHPYASHDYVAAVGAGQGWGVADVAAWSTWVSVRPIPGGGHDAAGPYPRTPIATDADLPSGLATLRDLGLVSVVLVPDPLAAPAPARMAGAFERCAAFKTHLLIDHAKGFAPTKHHRDRIRRAERRCVVRVVSLEAELTSWRTLYAELVQRHEIRGVAVFPDPYFPVLARTPAFVAFAAYVNGAIAGMTIWFEHAGVAISHLTAASALGYANGANYALNAAAIAHFSDAGVVDLGGGAGLVDDPDDGLAQFKRGFANAETVAYLCGAVLDPVRYARLVAETPPSGYFPAYRA
jgi:hypothetical protein